MDTWLPRFVCPECSGRLDEDAGDFVCAPCGERYTRRDRVYQFLTPHRRAASEAFVRQYRVVRERDGYRMTAPEYYRTLPEVTRRDPRRSEWCLRQESYCLLQRHLLRRGTVIRVLDVGAGNGWLSHRIAAAGHQVVAVDRLNDDVDGLGACRHYGTPFPCVQADFDALPFEPNQFDAVVFNGSLHYSPDVPSTLKKARRLLAPRGALVIMDSPMFRSEIDGQLMVGEKIRQFRTHYGLRDVVHPNVGFLTFAWLSDAETRLDLRGRFFRSRGPLLWRARRQVAKVRLRRAVATFGVWIATSRDGTASA